MSRLSLLASRAMEPYRKEPRQEPLDWLDNPSHSRKHFSRRLGWVLSVFMTSIVLNANQAHAEDNIPWVVMNWPPINFLENGAAPASPNQLGKGVADREMRELITLLPKYKHSFTLSNIQRVWAEMGSGQNLCHAASYKTPEHLKVAYMVPAMITSGIAIVVRHDHAAAFGLNVPVISLKEFLSKHKYLIGHVEAGRSYGSGVDSLLETEGSRLQRMIVGTTGELLRSLDLGRIDFTLEYPAVVSYKLQQAKFEHEIDVIDLDDEPQSNVVYVACTRNAWGKQAIKDIALAIKNVSATKAYRNAIYDWLPKNSLKHLKPQFELFYDSLRRAPDMIE